MRTTRKDKVVWRKLPGNKYLKVRLRPLLRVGPGCVWLASMAVGKSKRQINDWMNLRRSGKSLGTTLIGKQGISYQLFAMRQIMRWYEEIPQGDSISLRCESAYPEKQYRAWSRWFKQREDPRWECVPEHLAFFLYKPHVSDT